MYSALKKEGTRLYEYARKGQEVSREARDVRVELTRLEQAGGGQLEFELTCSKGTYVRTLAADMGRSLGCGAYLSRLRRVASGPFRVADAVTLDDLGALPNPDSVPLVPLNDALGHLRCAVLGPDAADRLRQGLQGALADVDAPAAGGDDPQGGGPARRSGGADRLGRGRGSVADPSGVPPSPDGITGLTPGFVCCGRHETRSS